MKNNKNNKYFFNWASGTGGDFLIGMLHLLYPFPHIKDIKVNNHNKWEHSFDEQSNEDRLRPFEIDDMSQIQQGLNDMNPGELFQYHQFISNPLQIPAGTAAINLTTSDIYQLSFVAHLYNIKARTPEGIHKYPARLILTINNYTNVLQIKQHLIFLTCFKEVMHLVLLLWIY
jgi:hypothetical protein